MKCNRALSQHYPQPQPLISPVHLAPLNDIILSRSTVRRCPSRLLTLLPLCIPPCCIRLVPQRLDVSLHGRVTITSRWLNNQMNHSGVVGIGGRELEFSPSPKSITTCPSDLGRTFRCKVVRLNSATLLLVKWDSPPSLMEIRRSTATQSQA